VRRVDGTEMSGGGKGGVDTQFGNEEGDACAESVGSCLCTLLCLPTGD